MSSIDESSKYIIRIWPKPHARKQRDKDLLDRLEELRNKISGAWPKDISVLKEIRDQRRKPYETDDR